MIPGAEGGGGAQPSISGSQPRLGIDLKTPAKPMAMKSSEKPTGFSANARPGGNGAAQSRKGPRMAGESASTK
jgi:hypothetical protein